MEFTQKLHPGQPFMPTMFKRLDGPDYTFGAPGKWQALFVFRGQHCPICKRYLTALEAKAKGFARLGVEVAAVSADTEAQTHLTAEAIKPSFPLLYGMGEGVMQDLGLYVSVPRSATETDHNFPEPALFVVRPDGRLQIVDIANAPFARPDLETLMGGLGFVIEKDYPIRGTHK